MKTTTLLLALSLTLPALAADEAHYKIKQGQLHDGGKVDVTILPDPKSFMVEMKFDIDKKPMVPVPGKLLKGTTVMEFPLKFKTEAGYKELQTKKAIGIPKAELKFIKRADTGDLKQAYFLEVHPTNKKSKIAIIYHPSLPAAGWRTVKITFLSNIPILDGYEVDAELKE